MISDKSMTNDESLLLEHAEKVVKLLNSFSKKSNISYPPVLKKLEYLYNRLSDFLDKEEVVAAASNVLSKDDISFVGLNTKESTNVLKQKTFLYDDSSKLECKTCHEVIPLFNQDYELSWALHYQECEEKYNLSSKKSLVDAMTKIQLSNKNTNVNDGSEEKDTPALGQKIPEISVTTTECGICREIIPIIDKNYNLAMELHIKNDAHQAAIALEKTLQEVVNSFPLGSKKETASLGHYITYDEIAKYHCELCQSYISGIDNVKQHIAGSGHKSKLDRQAKDADVIVLSNGVYFCNLCSAPLGNSSNALDHKQGKNHRKKVLVKLNKRHEDLVGKLEITEEKVWSKMPVGSKVHKMYFENIGENSVFCKLCATCLPKTEINILSHIHGKQHSRAFNNE